MNRREKRQARITVNAPDPLKKVIEQVARSQDRTVSHWFLRLAENDPSVRIALQQIGALREGH